MTNSSKFRSYRFWRYEFVKFINSHLTSYFISLFSNGEFYQILTLLFEKFANLS
ncbi:hypothetical protein OFO27_03410 [Campylobacter sp. CS_ED1]|nr:hypothetical protein [Campylobacter sp. CS_ED1]MDA3085579.1 hypothetical protein [Campylobacter sp. CS_ED1]MDA3090373.1 hypothetical protein [Campylobacter sp. CS_ED2]